MHANVAFLEFLNNREKASVFWLLVIIAFAFTQNGRDLAGSFLGTLRALLHPKLLLLFGCAAAYSALVVYVAAKVGVWHRDILKETIYWFVGTGLIFVGDAVGSPNKPGHLRRVAKKTFRFTVLLEFFVGLHVLPLWAEFVIIPIVLLFAGMQVVAEHDGSTPDVTKRFISAVLIVIGSGLFLWALLSVVHDVHGFASRENAERLWAAPGLSLALLPFLFLAARYSAWELARVRARYL